MITHGSVRISLAAVAGALLATIAGGAQAVAAPPAQLDGAATVVARYQAEIPRLMADEHIPGLAVALVGGQRGVCQRGFGYTARGRRPPIPADPLFSVQSMPKVFPAPAVMQAVQAHRLDLDAPITTYLPR